METVVLFGAGASNGAQHIVPEQPPLGNSLFAELCRFFPGSWATLPETARTAFRQSFESGMQVLWDSHSDAIPTLMQHMTLYLAQFRPDSSGQGLYSRFVFKLKENNILHTCLLSTLNYECVLDLALASLGIKIAYWETPMEPGTASLWKLHGSCNFLPSAIQATRGVSYTAGVVFNTDLTPSNPNDVIQFCLSDTSLYPAMALYMKAKPIQIGQSVIQDLQSRWADVVTTAKRILLVGVRPYPQDSHIWDPLARTKADLAFVGGKEEFDTWMTDHRQGSPGICLGSRWQRCFSETVTFVLGG